MDIVGTCIRIATGLESVRLLRLAVVVVVLAMSWLPSTAKAGCELLPGQVVTDSSNGDWICDTRYEAYEKVASFRIPSSYVPCNMVDAYIEERESTNWFGQWITYPGDTCGIGYRFTFGVGAASWPQGVPDGADPNLGSGSPNICEQSFGDPVNAGNGNKYEHVVEYQDPEGGELSFAWWYNSRSSPSTIRDGLMGSRRTNTYARNVVFSDAGATRAAFILRSDGSLVQFNLMGTSWTPRRDDGSSFYEGPAGGPAYVFESQDGSRDYFNEDGRLVSVLSPAGEQVDVNYDALGRISSVNNRMGRRLVFHLDAEDRLETLDLPDGGKIHFEFSSQALLTKVIYPNDDSTGYVYDESGHAPEGSLGLLTGTYDESGVRTSTTDYDELLRAVSTDRAGPERESVVYGIPTDGDPSLTTITTSSGATRELTFVVAGGRISTASATNACSAGNESNVSFLYDAYGNVLERDVNGKLEEREYDGRQLVNRVVRASGTQEEVTESFTWHPTLRFPVEKVVLDASDDLLNRRTWSYNARGQVTSSSESGVGGNETRTTSLRYCEQQDLDAGTCPLLGLVTQVNGPRTDVSDLTRYTYYASDDPTCASAPTTCPHRKGDLWKVTNAAGQVTETLKYDGAGRVLSVKDPNSVVTDFTYHPRGWLTARKVRGADDASETDDQITQIEYWPTGLVKKVIQPDGAFTAYTYDAAHRLTDIADNAGNTLHYTLDNAGNRLKEDTKDAGGALKRTLSRVYNQLGQLQTQADAQANPTDFTYDADGNLDTATDALGRITDNDYDPLNRLSRTLQDVGGIAAETRFEYDALDNLTKVVDPKGLETGYTYNGFGDLTQLSSPDTGTTTYTYDSAGNRKTQTDARGVTTSYAYDALNRLTSVSYPTSGLNTTYVYDAVSYVCQTGETYLKGRLSLMTDASGSTRYCYDRFGNLVRKAQTTSGKTLTVRYAYTKAGQLSAVTYPDGAVVDYVRNTLGQVTEVGVTSSGGTRQVLLNGATYYPFGPSAGWTYGNGRNLQRTYDQDYRPQAILDGTAGGLDLSYGFDEVGNLDALTTAVGATPLLSFGYDALNRLTQTKDGPTGTPIETYGYDAAGNRTSFQNSAGIQPYVYPTTSHKLASAGGIARTYDAAGNTTNIGGTAKVFLYDDTGRMSQAKQGSTVLASYAYNGKGERVRKTAGGTEIYTLYDEAGRWLGDYDGTGKPKQQAIWLDDLPVGLLAGAATAQTLRYVEPDHLGTPRAVIDPVRDVAVWSWDAKSEVFGNSPPHQDPDADGTAFVLDMRFPGQRYDSATGLNYNYFRDYGMDAGRYAQSDPVGLDGGVSTYAYGLSSPLQNIDPTGQFAWLVIPGVCAAGGCEAILGALGLSAWMSSPAGQEAVGKAADALSDATCPTDNDRCEIAKADARRIYNRLVVKRFPQFQSGGTRGRDAGHLQSIIQLQEALRDALRRVQLYCTPLPLEYNEWERAASLNSPGF